jgi:3-hydroxybutyrate dehydrogenase
MALKTSLAGKTAIVTGSTSGIGLGVLRSLAGEGANVVMNGFGDADVIEATRAAVEKEFGVKCTYNAADMTKPEQIAQMVADAGEVHILVNNAGIQHVALVENFPAEKWDAIIAINQSSAFHAARAVLAQMKKRGWGRIINVASAHGLVASAQKSAYVAAKHAVVGMTKVIALETAQDGITCNAICPGWVLTDLVKAQIEKRAKENGTSFEAEKLALVGEKHPNKEFVQVEELGAVAVFLSSDYAKSITGTHISVDGGWTAQ